MLLKIGRRDSCGLAVGEKIEGEHSSSVGSVRARRARKRRADDDGLLGEGNGSTKPEALPAAILGRHKFGKLQAGDHVEDVDAALVKVGVLAEGASA